LFAVGIEVGADEGLESSRELLNEASFVSLVVVSGIVLGRLVVGISPNREEPKSVEG